MNQKEKLYEKIGSMQQLAYVRPLSYLHGAAKGLHAFEVKNGPLCFSVMQDKCLDIADLSFRGVNFNFLSKPGLMGKTHMDTNGQEAQRSIMGGLLFTSGLENICAPCTDDGKDYPMHGRLRTTPAEHVCAQWQWEDDQYVLEISGEMREAELFGENMVLKRQIKTVYGSKTISICDQITNESFREEVMMLLYHFNFGYPFLDVGSRVVLPTTGITPRDQISEAAATHWDTMNPPAPNTSEQVFLHTLASRPNGKTSVAMINEQLGLGVKLTFSQQYLPYFMQWKSPVSGDYVMGLEPSNATVYGRIYHKENKNLHYLTPFSSERIELVLTVLEGAKEIKETIDEIRQIKESAKNN